MATKTVYAETCPTCCRAPGTPSRHYVGDSIVSGCVDHFHSGHLVTPSQSASWHYRREAKAIRKVSREMRGGYVTESVMHITAV